MFDAVATDSPNAGITMYGAQWCGDCRRSKRFLDANRIAFTYIDSQSFQFCLQILVRWFGHEAAIGENNDRDTLRAANIHNFLRGGRV